MTPADVDTGAPRLRSLDRRAPGGAPEGLADKPGDLWLDKGKSRGSYRTKPMEPDPDRPKPPYLVPYEPVRIISGYGERRGRRIHEGIDFAGAGPDCGLGTPIYSIGRARIRLIGRSRQDPREFGRPLTRGGTAIRGGRRLPVSAEIDGYGRVYFFTRNRGRWRAGTTVVTELLDGPLAGYTVRYMHLADVHPELRVGDIVDAGEEFALLGGTAVQESIPHLHLDALNPQGEPFDLTPYLDFGGAAVTVEGSGEDSEESSEIPGC